MKEKIRTHPVIASVISVILIMAAYLLVRIIIENFIKINGITLLYLDGVLRLIFSLPAIIILGIVTHDNGFRYVFSIRGFKNALFGSIVILLCLIIQLIHLFNISKFNTGIASFILAIILFDSINAVFEEVMFRGLLITAAQNRWGNTLGGRVFIILISSVLFGLGHINNGVYSALLASIIGMTLSSIYIFSSNLLVPMIIHALWNIIEKTINILIVDVYSLTLLTVIQTVQLIIFFIAMPLFTIYISKNDSYKNIKENRLYRKNGVVYNDKWD